MHTHSNTKHRDLAGIWGKSQVYEQTFQGHHLGPRQLLGQE